MGYNLYVVINNNHKKGLFRNTLYISYNHSCYKDYWYALNDWHNNNLEKVKHNLSQSIKKLYKEGYRPKIYQRDGAWGKSKNTFLYNLEIIRYAISDLPNNSMCYTDEKPKINDYYYSYDYDIYGYMCIETSFYRIDLQNKSHAKKCIKIINKLGNKKDKELLPEIKKRYEL